MFVDASAFSNFTPHINKTSKSITATLAPLPDRQWYEREKHLARLAHLHEAVTAERQREETFRPKINRGSSSGALLSSEDGRVPLIDRTNAPRSQAPPDDPEMTLKPKINEVSKKMDDAARTQVDETHMVRKQVQQLWADFADGKNMSAASVVRALQSMEIRDPALIDKVLLALNVDPEDEAKRYVEYDRFVRVMNLALKAAISRPSAQAASSFSPQQQHPPQLVASKLDRSQPHRSPAEDKRKTLVEKTVLSSKVTAAKAGSLTAKSPAASASAKPPQGTTGRATNTSCRTSASPSPSTITLQPSKSVGTNSNREQSAPTTMPTDAFEVVPQQQRRAASSQPNRYSHGGTSPPPSTSVKKSTHYDPLGSCTFSPSINKNIDVSLKGPVTRERFTGGRSLVDLASKLQQEALEEEECTFRPLLSKIHQPILSSGNQLQQQQQQQQSAGRGGLAIATAMPGFEKAVKRMELGRERAVHHFEETLRSVSGASSVDLTTTPRQGGTAPTASQLGPTEVQPFRLRSSVRGMEREAQKPLLYVDVDLPHGRCGRIGVHRGDDAEQLARNFCASYSLDENTVSRLTQILQEKLALVQREKTRSVWV